EAGAARRPRRPQAAGPHRRLRTSAPAKHHDQAGRGRRRLAAQATDRPRVGPMRTAAVVPLRLDNRPVTAGTATYQSPLPPPGTIHGRLSVIGWTTAGCGALVVFLAIGFLVPLFGSLHQLARLALTNGPPVPSTTCSTSARYVRSPPAPWPLVPTSLAWLRACARGWGWLGRWARACRSSVCSWSESPAWPGRRSTRVTSRQRCSSSPASP